MEYGIPHYLKRDATIRMAHGYNTREKPESCHARVLGVIRT